uniref:Uncharacterized protein n=1 Tax=Anguilla anguilla TaxID=7936 RepID=A0A0E9VEY2_ANGAN
MFLHQSIKTSYREKTFLIRHTKDTLCTL